MLTIIRSMKTFKSLKTIAETCGYRTTNLHFLVASQELQLVGARNFSVQPTFKKAQEGIHHQQHLEQLIYRLDVEEQNNGRISPSAVDNVYRKMLTYKGVSPTHAHLLLRCCGHLMPEEIPSVRTEMAHKIMQAMDSRGLVADLSHYNALLSVYLENEHDFSPMDFLSELQQKQLQPNRVTYQRLVVRYAQLGDIEGITKILEFMKEKNIAITETVFNALILGHSRANDLQSAKDILQTMAQNKLEPTVDTYAVLAVAQAEHGLLDDIKDTIRLAQEKDHLLCHSDLLEVVYSLAVRGHQHHIPQVLSLIKKSRGFNRDCRNVICRLINAGHDDVAVQLYSHMDVLAEHSSQASLSIGQFFVRHLVIRNRPLAILLSFCEDHSGSSPHLLHRALEAAVEHNTDMALPIMDAILAKGAQLRAHYFWPLIMNRVNADDLEGVYRVLESMITRSVNVTRDTMVYYVLPYLLTRGGQSDEEVLHKLKKTGISIPDSINSIVYYYLRNKNMGVAVELVSEYGIRLRPSLRYELAPAVIQSEAYEDAATLLAQMEPWQGSNEEQFTAGEGEQKTGGDEQMDFVGYFLMELANKTQQVTSFNMTAMLQALKARGLSVSRQMESALLHRLGSRATADDRALLDTLASGTLHRVKLQRGTTRYASNRSVEELEAQLQQHVDDGRNTRHVLTDLLVLHCRAGRVEQAELVSKRLEVEHQFPLSVGLRVLLLDMYYGANNLASAMQTYKSLKETDPDITLLPTKILKLAHLLVREDNIDEAVSLLEAEGCKSHQKATVRQDDNSDALASNDNFVEVLVSQILHPLSQRGAVSDVKRLQDAIVKGGFALPSPRLLGTVVAAHVANNDLDSAMDAFFSIKQEYNILPGKHEILKELIRKEDTERLQQVVDMSRTLHGESNSLFDLAVAFSDEGRPKEAKRILETPGLRVRQTRLNSQFEIYLKYKETKRMEDLLEVTKDMFGLDRRPLYQYMLQAHIADEDCNKALALWTQMQEEDLPIAEKFLYDLGSFLELNGVAVPFAVPKNVPEAPLSVSTPVSASASTKDDPMREKFRQLLSGGKVDDALTLHHKLCNDVSAPLHARDTLGLVHLLLDLNRREDAIRVVKNTPLLGGRIFGKFQAFRRLLMLSADAGDWNTVIDFVDGAPPSEAGRYSFAVCRAALRSGRVDDCFKRFIVSLEQPYTDEADRTSNLGKVFPKAGFLELLHNDPSILPQFKELSVKYKEIGLLQPQATLWAYYFIQNDNDNMNQVMAELQSGEQCLPHTAVCSHLRQTQDMSLAPRLLDILHAEPRLASPNAITEVYDAWIDTLCKQNKPQEGLAVLQSALVHHPLSSMKRVTLRRLKTAAAAQNITFPYSVPTVKQYSQQQDSSSSSSSESDE